MELSKVIDDVFTDYGCSLWLTPYICLKVKNCNADRFASFSEDIQLELEFTSDYSYIRGKSLCKIFRGTLVELLKTKTQNYTLDADKSLAVGCLENFIHDWETGGPDSECLKKLKKNINDQVKMTEGQIQAVLCHHLFTPLVTEGEVFADSLSYRNSTNSKLQNPECPFCSQAVNVANTNFGCKKLWHGRADIIIKSKDSKKVVKIATETDEETEEEPLPKKPKVEIKTSVLDGLVNLLPEKNYRQAISQTIINAFLAVKQKNSLEDRLIPSFFATGERIFINFYNVKYDILMVQSKYLALFEKDQIDFHTMLCIWMALNFEKFQCCFVDEDCQVSGFRDHLIKQNVLEMYMNEVDFAFPSVGKPKQVDREFYVDPDDIVKLKAGIKEELKTN